MGVIKKAFGFLLFLGSYLLATALNLGIWFFGSMAIGIVFLLFPLSLVNLFRKIFPEETSHYVIEFDFSFYDLILYIPGLVIVYYSLRYWAGPFMMFMFYNFIVNYQKSIWKDIMDDLRKIKA